MNCSTIEDVISEMDRRWRRLARAGDWRAVFADSYLRTTVQVLTATQRDGYFRDPAWVVKLDCAFAQRYFDAIDAWDAHRTCPRPWRIAFRNATDKRTVVVQDLLLGMNAHINFDLPFALEATVPVGADPALLAVRHDDHERL